MIFTTMLLALLPVGQAAEVEVRLPVSRDTRISSVDSEARASPGGSGRLKVKSYQEFSLFDIDPGPILGRVVAGATLHFRNVGDPPPTRLTVGSIASQWFEGKTEGDAPEPGASSFVFQKNLDVPWTRTGGDLSEMILGRGGSIWRSAEATPPDAEGWQAVAVEPSVVAARAAGVSGGFVLFDDEGTRWRRNGEEFKTFPFPNRYVASRDAGKASAPYLVVTLGAKDDQPPGAPSDFTFRSFDLPPGESLVEWKTPDDHGPAGVIGFFVRVDGRDAPRYTIPAAPKAGERVRMHVRDLALEPGGKARLAVQAVDGAGNIGPEATADIVVAPARPVSLPRAIPSPAAPVAPLPRLGDFEVAVIDELDVIDPVKGAMTPARPPSHLAANHLWDASSRTIRLQAARGEFVAFQVVIKGDGAPNVAPELTFEGAPMPVEFGRYQDVPTDRGFAPDPIVPLDRPELNPVPNRTSRSLHVELYAPKDATPGAHRGSLVLKSADARLALPIELTVLPFALPDHLGFIAEMNCYGLPENERDYYRLAHAHRTVLNRVPYSQSGKVADGCAPVWDGKRLDWDAWDRRFGPYLDGSAFADLPRGGVPIECFYLPMHENWPTPTDGAYNGGYWADRAFPDSYRAAFVEVVRQSAEHFAEKGWRSTLFQGFLNNKVDFKSKGWSRGSSPWLLDEPAHFQDFIALRYFGEAFHEGVRRAGGDRPARMVFRADISRPQWQRDALDGVLDYLVVGSAFRRYRSLVLDQERDFGVIALEYGSANAIGESNGQAVAWCLDAWSLGADGVVPWQTIGNRASWKKADRLALLYPSPWPDRSEPIPSIRLKAYRRGQQDVEYLALLARAQGVPRWAVGLAVRQALNPAAIPRRTGVGIEDAGVLDYGALRPEDFAALRARVARALVDSHRIPSPDAPRFRTPARDLKGLKPWRVSTDAPPRNREFRHSRRRDDADFGWESS